MSNYLEISDKLNLTEMLRQYTQIPVKRIWIDQHLLEQDTEASISRLRDLSADICDFYSAVNPDIIVKGQHSGLSILIDDDGIYVDERV